jgi:CelD/BcsL family acetyltransferase involved in cellulose biosynthesis
MRVTVVRPADLAASEASLWASFQESTPALQNPFLSLTFARVVGGIRQNARVAVVEANGHIEAFLAFELEPGRMGMPIGYPMNNLQAFVTRGAPIDARRVVRKAGLRGWRFIAAPLEQDALVAHHYAGTAVGAPVIDLSDGYASYFSGRSHNLATEVARKRRSLERRFGPISLEWGNPAQEHIRRLMDWKCARYGGARELFADPTARRIVEEFATTSDEDCGGLVNVLRAGDRVAAVISSLACHGGLSGWFTAYDLDLRKSSPGTILVLATAEEAARRGIGRIDMGAGQDTYKFRLANDSYPVAGGAVWASPGEKAARAIYRRFRAPAEAGRS